MQLLSELVHRNISSLPIFNSYAMFFLGWKAVQSRKLRPTLEMNKRHNETKEQQQSDDSTENFSDAKDEVRINVVISSEQLMDINL